MEHKAKILEYYHSGRYECDYDFHQSLREAVKELNLYQWVPFLQSQMQALKKIKELTEINAKSLDEDYDDEQGVCQTYKIRSMLNHLSSKEVPAIVSECEALKWQSYEVKICRALSGKTQYEAILQRIHTTIHSQQFRIDSMLFTALFEQFHGNQLSQCNQVYNQTVQYFLNFLNSQRQRFHTLLEAQECSNITQLNKIKSYIGVLFIIVRTCIRFCEVLKILTGKNNLSLKFTVVKKQIQKLIKKYPDWKFQNQKDDLFKVLPIFKKAIKSGQSLTKAQICRWCFKPLSKEYNFHAFCNTLITKKELFK